VLVEHFAQQSNLRFSAAKHFGPAAMETLVRYRWPGNIRELIHVVQQSVVLSDRDVIEPEDLPASVALSVLETSASPGEVPSLREVQRRHVLGVIEAAGGNRAQAARNLQISERNLYRLLRRYARQSGPPDGTDTDTSS